MQYNLMAATAKQQVCVLEVMLCPNNTSILTTHTWLEWLHAECGCVDMTYPSHGDAILNGYVGLWIHT